MNALSGPSGPLAAYRAGALLAGCYIALLIRTDPTPEALWTMLAVFAAAAVSSTVGFGFAALCGVALLHLLGDRMHALEITLICGVASQAMMVWTLRRDIDWQAFPGFLIGASAGLPVGLYVLLHGQSKPAAQALGVLLMMHAILTIWRRPSVINVPRGLGDTIVGLLGGITGGIAAFSAAPVVIWCGLKGASKERQRGVWQPFTLVLQLACVAVLVAGEFAGARSRDFDWSGLLYLPAALFGTSLGLAVFDRMNERQFALSVRTLLIVCGVSLLL